jgi:hypothetical protein
VRADSPLSRPAPRRPGSRPPQAPLKRRPKQLDAEPRLHRPPAAPTGQRPACRGRLRRIGTYTDVAPALGAIFTD